MEQKIALKNPWYNRTIVEKHGLYPLVVDGLSVADTIEKAQEIINDDHLSDSDSAVVTGVLTKSIKFIKFSSMFNNLNLNNFQNGFYQNHFSKI